MGKQRKKIKGGFGLGPGLGEGLRGSQFPCGVGLDNAPRKIGRCSHLKFSGQPDTPSPSESPS